MGNSFGVEIYTDSENQQRIKYQESERKINDQKFNQKELVDGIYPNEWFEKKCYHAFSASVLGKINIVEPVLSFYLSGKGHDEVLKILESKLKANMQNKIH